MFVSEGALVVVGFGGVAEVVLGGYYANPMYSNVFIPFSVREKVCVTHGEQGSLGMRGHSCAVEIIINMRAHWIYKTQNRCGVLHTTVQEP